MVRRVVASRLVGQRWHVQALGEVRVERATPLHCADIETEWEPLRAEDDRDLAWRWTKIGPTLRDGFVLIGAHPLSIWGSTKEEPIRLPGGRYYRLDFLEARPDHRGLRVVGLFTMALVAVRALEQDADGVVLASFDVPKLIAFYEGLGAIRRRPTGWNLPRNLVPFQLDAQALEQLARFADAHHDDQSATQEDP